MLKKNIHINTSIIPKPVSQTINNGVFNLAEKIEIIYDSSFVNEVEYLKSNFPINEGSNQNFIRIEKNSLLKEEEYKLLIRTNEIIINASTPRGAMHAIQSLRQLLPNEIKKTKKIFQLNAWRFMIIQNLNGEDYFLIVVDISWKKNL